MHTVYLVRDANITPPGYLSFIADKDEVILEETVFGSQKYSEALLHASLLFDFFSKKKSLKLASYIESPFQSTNIVCYSEEEFCARKVKEHVLYKSLLEEYYALLLETDSDTAFTHVVHARFLTDEQRAKLLFYIKLKAKCKGLSSIDENLLS